jgi:hypothetical protein
MLFPAWSVRNAVMSASGVEFWYISWAKITAKLACVWKSYPQRLD